MGNLLGGSWSSTRLLWRSGREEHQNMVFEGEQPLESVL